MPTEFERRVYRALKEVPRGYVTTYGLLARAIGCGSARAVGQALKKNPCAPEIPCHRVIMSDLRIGGFHGSGSGLAGVRKRKMLEEEGVVFRSGELVDPGRVFRYNN